jgi:cell division protein FtsB
MGALDYAINMGQSADIDRLEEICEKQQKEIDELKQNVEMLSKWILHLKGIECPTTPNNA